MSQSAHEKMVARLSPLVRQCLEEGKESLMAQLDRKIQRKGLDMIYPTLLDSSHILVEIYLAALKHLFHHNLGAVIEDLIKHPDEAHLIQNLISPCRAAIQKWGPVLQDRTSGLIKRQIMKSVVGSLAETPEIILNPTIPFLIGHLKKMPFPDLFQWFQSDDSPSPVNYEVM